MTEQEARENAVAALRAECAEARADGLAALNALANVQVCLESLDAMEATDNPLLKSALLIALTVAYFRAFEQVTEDTTGRKRTFSFRSVKGSNKKLHLALQQFRGDYLEHAKQDVNDFELCFITQTITSTPLNGGPPHKVTTGGSQARASMPMIPSGRPLDVLREHLTAIRTAAANQLSKCLFQHETAMVLRLQLGDKPGAKFSHKGDWAPPPGTRAAVPNRPEAHIVRAIAPEELGAEFSTLRYWLEMDDMGRMEMVETLTGGNAPGVQPAVKISRPAVDQD